MQIYQQCMQQALVFSLFLDSLLKSTSSKHKIEFLRLMVEELQALQANVVVGHRLEIIIDHRLASVAAADAIFRL